MRMQRWQGRLASLCLDADEVRWLASVQQSLTEMGRGERFVMDYLRTSARERERWYVGLPLIGFGMLGLALFARALRKPKR